MRCECYSILDYSTLLSDIVLDAVRNKNATSIERPSAQVGAATEGIDCGTSSRPQIINKFMSQKR